MSEKYELVERLKDRRYREAYIRSGINVNIPSQIRALRLRNQMTQGELASEARMRQPRVSAMEKPGATKFNLETLIRLASAFRVGLIVKFAPISKMRDWENGFSQDAFNVVTFEHDGGLQAAAPVGLVATGNSGWLLHSVTNDVIAPQENRRAQVVTRYLVGGVEAPSATVSVRG